MALARRAPPWFWIVTLLLLLWQAMGLLSFYEHVTNGAEAMGAVPSDYDRQLIASLPRWYDWVYAVATWGGLAAGIALVLRRAIAVPLAIVSLAAIVVMFGWMFLATDIIAMKGWWTTYFPAAIFAIGAFTLWFAMTAKARGWIV